MSRTMLALVVALVLAAFGWGLFAFADNQPENTVPIPPEILPAVVAIACEQALARAGDAEIALAQYSDRDRETVGERMALIEVRDTALEYFRENCPWPK